MMSAQQIWNIYVGDQTPEEWKAQELWGDDLEEQVWEYSKWVHEWMRLDGGMKPLPVDEIAAGLFQVLT